MKIFLAALVCFAALPALAHKPAPAYHEVGRIAVGGEGGWDYLTIDADAHRLYVKYGFAPLAGPERFMERYQPNAYT